MILTHPAFLSFPIVSRAILWANPDPGTALWKAVAVVLLACETFLVERALRTAKKRATLSVLSDVVAMTVCALLVPPPEFWVLAALAAAAGILKYLVRRFPFLMPPPRGTEDRDGDCGAGQDEKK